MKMIYSIHWTVLEISLPETTMITKFNKLTQTHHEAKEASTVILLSYIIEKIYELIEQIQFLQHLVTKLFVPQRSCKGKIQRILRVRLEISKKVLKIYIFL
jgi:hypothetical protein